uniref:cilia- and flagella-associated protein 100-like n=1 Tax=Myxine glutinosa TaxID=7769 RepID=UPI00358FB616
MSKCENPFRRPSGENLLAIREEERSRKEQERQRQKKQHVHEKTTVARSLHARTAASKHQLLSGTFEEQSENPEKYDVVGKKRHPVFPPSTTHGLHVEKETLSEFVNSKREMFLMQYSLSVKQEEMHKLSALALSEEQRLAQAEKCLENEALQFDEFLKDNCHTSIEAIKMVEIETKKKLDTILEIKRENMHLALLKSEIAKSEDALKQYMEYKAFLIKLPLTRVPATKTTCSTDSKVMEETAGSISGTDVNTGIEIENQHILPSSEFDESDEELDLRCSKPEEVLHLLKELEEKNISLILDSQVTEEALEEVWQNIASTEQNMNRETDLLHDQLASLKDNIAQETEKTAALQLKAKMLTEGRPLKKTRKEDLNLGSSQCSDISTKKPSRLDVSLDHQCGKPEEVTLRIEPDPVLLENLSKKVAHVYRTCLHLDQTNADALQMLTSIEKRLEELFQQLETLPADCVAKAQREKSKERCMRMHEEKVRQEKKEKERRLHKAMERSQAEHKAQVGRKPMFRSAPPQTKRTRHKSHKQDDREADEMHYFFS